MSYCKHKDLIESGSDRLIIGCRDCGMSVLEMLLDMSARIEHLESIIEEIDNLGIIRN